ncbi:MAG: hypothetical protein Q4E89_07050 [Eubacteriales bacterium]|nr:hypothetical protein [Eubacteriales bacterium]
MKREIKRKAVLAVGAAFVLAAGVWASFEDSVEVTNFLSMGDVQISLAEYELEEEGTEIPYTNSVQIMPGDTISKIPRITNEGEPCWIRARVLYTNSMEEEEGLEASLLLGVSPKWKRQGEYFYYTQVLKNGESADLFKAVEIPWKWTEVHTKQELSITVEADAVQAVHFQPDFSAASPWGDIDVEVCVHERNGRIVDAAEKVELCVEFEGEAHRLVAVPLDFFQNFSDAMPGDELCDKVLIKNTTQEEAEIFFRTGLEEMTREEQEFLEKLELRLSYAGRLLYSGNLAAREADSDISLGTFSPGEEGSLSFCILVPPELGNAYALRQGRVKWIFSVKQEEGQITAPANPTASEEQTTSPVKTGDNTPIFLWIMTIVLAGIAAGCIIFHRKRGGRHHEE